MDKLKSILSPGHKSDENTMYGSGDNSGKVAGEGSHFGDTKSGNVPSDAASTTAIKEGVSGSAEGSTANTGALKAAQLASGASTSESGGLPIYSEMTGKPDASASPYSSHNVDPRVDGSKGLASSAAATAFEADKSNRGPAHESVATVPAETSTQSNIGTAVTTGTAPTSSIASPETSAAAHTSSVETTPSAATQSSALPAVSGKTVDEPEHHFNKDAAIGVAAAGATGIGAHEASKFHESSATDSTKASTTEDSGSSGPLGSLRDLINQKIGVGSDAISTDSSAAHTSSTSATTGAAAGAATGSNVGSTSATTDSSSTGTALRPLIDEKTNIAQSQNTTSSETHHTRDAALGAATGAGLAGSYEYLKKDKDTPSETSTAQPSTTEPASTTGPSHTSSTTETTPAVQPAAFQSTAPIQPAVNEENTDKDKHVGRDAAIGAGAAGVGAAAYEHHKNEEDEKAAEKARKEAEKQHEKDVKEQEKEARKAEKEHEKEVKQHEKEVAKAEKQHEKEVKKAEKEHEKEVKQAEKQAAKEEKQHQKELKAAEKEHEKELKEAQKEQEKELKAQEKAAKEAEKERHEKEAAFAGVAGAAGAAGLAEHEHDKKEELPIRSRTEATPAEDTTQRDRLASLADTRAEGRIHSTDATAAGAAGLGAAGLGAAGLAEHEHAKSAEDPTMRERLGSLAEDRGEGKVKPSADIPPTTTSGTGVASYEAAHGQDTEPKERKGSILDVFKRHKDSEDDAAKAGAVGATAGAAAGIAEHEHNKGSEDMSVRDRLGSLAEDRGEGKVKPSADIPPTTTSGSGIATYEADKEAHNEAHTESKERKGSILDVFKRHKDSDDKHDDHKHEKEAAAAGAGAIGVLEFEKHHDSTNASTADVPQTVQEETATQSEAPQSVQEQKVYRDAFGRLKSDPTEKSAEPSAPTAGVIRNDLGQLAPAVQEETAPQSEAPESVQEQKVYRDAFGRLKSDPTEKSAEPSAPAAGVIRNDLGQFEQADATDSVDTTGNEHRGLEAAAVGAGVGAVGAHEHNKHEETQKHAHHYLHHKDADRHSYASHPDHDKTHPAHDHPAAESRLGESATADQTAAGPVGGLGESRGFFNEGYVHEKTEDDLKAEKRNSIAGVGLLHREGRFHGKEGGAPGAVGLPPSERDQAYVESQKHLPTLHGNYGAHAEQKAKETSGQDGTFHVDDSASGPNKLHKDPPADHPAAAAAATSSAATDLLHGHHAGSLKDTPDTNVENPKHDPANMGYDGKTHLNLG